MSKKSHKIRFTFLFLFIYLFVNNEEFSSKIEIMRVQPFHDLFKSKTIKNKTILIFEPNKYHHECSPGYAKYFIDLGYNVDILMHFLGINAFNLFEKKDKIRVFIFSGLNHIKMKAKKLSDIIKKYDFVLLQTVDIDKKDLYIDLELLNMNNSFFVFHDISLIDQIFSKYLYKNRIWTLGNFTDYLQINPHYFGNIRLKAKNNITRFFLTSTFGRNYTYLIEVSERLIKENYNFELIILGRARDFDSNKIPIYLTNHFKIKYNAPYSEMYNAVDSSDYIIIPLDQNSTNDNAYRTYKVTGSIQLSYGFLKPVIISEEFAQFYSLDNKNSLIYNKSSLYYVLKNAILLNNNEYKKLQNNLYSIKKKIYKNSFDNVKKSLRNQKH